MKKTRLFCFLAICLTLITISSIDKTFENDTFFTIPTGEYILENGIDDVEPFTWHENLKFTKLRWAFDISVAKLYELGGFDALYIFTIIISIVIALTLFITLTKRNNYIGVSFAITVFSILSVKGYLTCRAQIISYLLFVLEMYFIEKMMVTGKKQYSVYLIVISALILCFHSSVWLMYFILFIPYVFEWILNITKINKLIEKTDKIIIQEMDNKKVKLLLITILVSMISGFCTPLGLSPYTYSIKTMMGFSSKIILELQPVYIEKTFSLCCICLVIVSILGLTKTKITVTDLFYIIIFLILSKLAERNMYIAILILSFPIARLVSTCIDTYNKKSFFNEIEMYSNKRLAPKLVILAACSIIIQSNIKNVSNHQYIDENLYPVNASEYIINNVDLENSRIYNNFNIGSYLEFKGIPSFIDSRSEVYCKEFNNVTILEDMAKFELFSAMNADEIVDKYKFTHLITEARS